MKRRERAGREKTTLYTIKACGEGEDDPWPVRVGPFSKVLFLLILLEFREKSGPGKHKGEGPMNEIDKKVKGP